MINEITTLTYSIQDSLQDLDRHVDENGKVILDVIYKDFVAMRVYLARLCGTIEGKAIAKKQRGAIAKKQRGKNGR